MLSGSKLESACGLPTVMLSGSKLESACSLPTVILSGSKLESACSLSTVILSGSRLKSVCSQQFCHNCVESYGKTVSRILVEWCLAVQLFQNLIAALVLSHNNSCVYFVTSGHIFSPLEAMQN